MKKQRDILNRIPKKNIMVLLLTASLMTLCSCGNSTTAKQALEIDSSADIQAENISANIAATELQKTTADTVEALDAYLCILYDVYGGDDIVDLYTDDNGILCVWYGVCSRETEYYSHTYDSYLIKNDTLYGYYKTEDADEFIFMENGYTNVLLNGYGATHYLEYQKEEYYFSY